MTADDNHYPGPHLPSVVAFIVTVLLAYGIFAVSLWVYSLVYP